jgi:hypothetical protein
MDRLASRFAPYGTAPAPDSSAKGPSESAGSFSGGGGYDPSLRRLERAYGFLRLPTDPVTHR